MIPSRPGVDRDGLDGGHGSDPDCFALFRAPLKHCHIGAFRSEKPPKRAHFGRVSKIWIFECEDFIRRVWNWSSYRCKSCKPILSKTFLRPIYRLCRHCKDFPAFLSRFLHFLLLFSNQDRVGGMSAFSHWWFYSREREVGWGGGGDAGHWSMRRKGGEDGCELPHFIPKIWHFCCCPEWRWVSIYLAKKRRQCK